MFTKELWSLNQFKSGSNEGAAACFDINRFI
jgi:hypothetical protein